MGDKDDEDDPTVPFVEVDSQGNQKTTEWSEDHCRLLYLLSIYARAALTPNDQEGWIRQTALMVLMFEGITAGKLDFDYAPASILISHEGVSRRKWMNITQEGKSAIDDLREGGLVNGLKQTTEDFQPVTAYQVSGKGMRFVNQLPKALRDDVHTFVWAPGTRERLDISFNGETFTLSGPDEYVKESSATETEDVSYVCSPYLPICLRAPVMHGHELNPLTDNSRRAHESASGESTIADELSEAIILGHVTAMVGEWIPFGSNQIVALNERLGALDRCQGGLFTATVDKNPTDTKLSAPGPTVVSILDYDFVKFINFEAEINYPEDEGIVQVENFGMHLNVDGTIVYGIKVEAILDRQCDDVSLDHLSRVLVDVHQDSSEIMNDLLSQYQRSLLEMLFMGDMHARNKFNMILAAEIKPKQPADMYMDKADFENELKQVIGDLRVCHDLSDDDVVIVGRDGLLMAGPNVYACEKLLVAYMSLLCRELFIRNYFVRTFMLSKSLHKIRKLILSYQADPNSVGRIRDLLSCASRDIVLLREILEYLRESIDEMQIPNLEETSNPTVVRLHRALDVHQMKKDVMLRCVDLDKLSEGSVNDLRTLQDASEVINTKQLEDVFKNVESNTKALVDGADATERGSKSLTMISNILFGSFAFEVIDRLSGGSLNIAVPDWVDLYLKDGGGAIFGGEMFPIIAVPGFWFFLNMLLFILVVIWGMYQQAALLDETKDALAVRVKLNIKVNLEKLGAYLASRKILVMESTLDSTMKVHKVSWAEEEGPPGPDKKPVVVWGGKDCFPEIEIIYTDFGFLLAALFQVDGKKTPFKERELIETFKGILMQHDVLVDEKDFPKGAKVADVGADRDDQVNPEKVAVPEKDTDGGK